MGTKLSYKNTNICTFSSGNPVFLFILYTFTAIYYISYPDSTIYIEREKKEPNILPTLLYIEELAISRLLSENHIFAKQCFLLFSKCVYVRHVGICIRYIRILIYSSIANTICIYKTDSDSD